MKYTFMSPSTAESFEVNLGLLSSVVALTAFKQIARPFETAYLLDFAKQRAKELVVNASFTVFGVGHGGGEEVRECSEEWCVLHQEGSENSRGQKRIPQPAMGSHAPLSGKI